MRSNESDSGPISKAKRLEHLFLNWKQNGFVSFWDVFHTDICNHHSVLSHFSPFCSFSWLLPPLSRASLRWAPRKTLRDGSVSHHLRTWPAQHSKGPLLGILIKHLSPVSIVRCLLSSEHKWSAQSVPLWNGTYFGATANFDECEYGLRLKTRFPLKSSLCPCI